MFKVNVAPDMGMYNLLRSQGYDPAYALAEFVDNALQAHLKSRPRTSKSAPAPLRVSIKFYSAEYAPDPNLAQSIIIEDDGPGIKKDELARAMKPARPSQSAGLSEFGIGMKASAVWFSDTWSLRTRPSGDANEYSLDFQLQQLLQAATASVSVKETKAASTWRGTQIRLLRTRRIIDRTRFEEICQQLTDIYQRFTIGASPQLVLTAFLDDSPTDLKFDPESIAPVLVAPVYKKIGKEFISLGKDKTWTVSINTTFLGKSVTGEISILETGSYRGNPGLVMFRYDRVIRGTRKRPYQPLELFKTGNKYASQRVYGKLFVDGLPVTYTKDGFDFEDAAFCAQLRTQQELLDLFAQAENYRSKDGAVQHFKTEKEYYDSIAPKKPAATLRAKASTAPTSVPDKACVDPKSADGNPKPPAAAPAKLTSPAAPAPDPFVVVMENLKRSTKTSAALLTIIDEILILYRSRRPIAIAMCLRVVLESGLLAKIERDFPAEYPKVSGKAVASLINWMAGNSSLFFNPQRDVKVIKCLHSISAGSQADVVLMNNASHGHYQLGLDELKRFVNNLEQLLNWSYT